MLVSSIPETDCKLVVAELQALPTTEAYNSLRGIVCEIIEAALTKRTHIDSYVRLLVDFASHASALVGPANFHGTLEEVFRKYLKIGCFEAYDRTDCENGPTTASGEARKRLQTFIQ